MRGTRASMPVGRKATAPKKAGPAKAGPATIDGYLASLRPDQRAAVQRLREIIQATAPRAEECISYKMPAFRLDGKGLIWFAAAAKHAAVYGVTESYQGEFEGYETSGRGTLRFPLGAPIPTALVRRVVKARRATIAGRPRRATAAARR
jgi:uncharacterized protein YdhG (YjbR/CyaY superfamily)